MPRLHGVPCPSRDPQATAVNWVYPTGLCVEKEPTRPTIPGYVRLHRHDVAVLHRENACRKRLGRLPAPRSWDRKVSPNVAAADGVVPAGSPLVHIRCRRPQRSRLRRGARTFAAPANENVTVLQTNARFVVCGQVSHANSRSNRFSEFLHHAPEL